MTDKRDGERELEQVRSMQLKFEEAKIDAPYPL